MQNRIPAAISPFVFTRIKNLQVAIRLMLVGIIFVPLAYAQKRIEMPQSRSFIDAYQIALTLAQEQPGSRVMTVASTFSMYPAIDWDSIVVIVPIPLKQIKVGDVVCFRDKRLDGTHTILHRVEKILVKDHRLMTRGDNLERADPRPVSADALIGKAVYIVYFDRMGENRPVDYAMPTPLRREQVVPL